MKALGTGTILKVGKIKVATEVNINNRFHQKMKPFLGRPQNTWCHKAGHGTLAVTLQPGQMHWRRNCCSDYGHPYLVAH
jgi:hypothetical protein